MSRYEVEYNQYDPFEPWSIYDTLEGIVVEWFETEEEAEYTAEELENENQES